MMKVLAKMSQFVNKTFALWVVIFGIAGFVFPEIFKQIVPGSLSCRRGDVRHGPHALALGLP